MGNIILYNFEESNSSLEANQNYYEHSIDCGEIGDHDVCVDTDYIIDSECIIANIDSVTVDTGILAGELVNQGELIDIINDLCKEASFDEVFDILVTISPDYNDE